MKITRDIDREILRRADAKESARSIGRALNLSVQRVTATWRASRGTPFPIPLGARANRTDKRAPLFPKRNP